MVEGRCDDIRRIKMLLLATNVVGDCHLKCKALETWATESKK